MSWNMEKSVIPAKELCVILGKMSRFLQLLKQDFTLLTHAKIDDLFCFFEIAKNVFFWFY